MKLEEIKNLDIENETEKQVLNLHSSAIHVENKVCLKARLAWLYMVYRAFPYLKDCQKFVIQLSDLKKSINYTSTNNKILKNLLKELTHTTVEWNILEKDKNIWEVNSLLAGCQIDKGTGKITFAFSPLIQERLCNPKLYAKINLIISKRLKSKHSLAIYCLLIDYLFIKNNYGEKNFTVEELRKYLGLEDHEYIRVVNLHQEVIKRAVNEINENSDVKTDVVPIRVEKGKIIGFKFKMSVKDEYLEFYKPKNIINQQSDFFDLLEVPKLEKREEDKAIQKKTEFIEINNPELKKFYAEHDISTKTKTVQEKLKEIRETFHDQFENYLLFLMNYTNQEAKKTSIKKYSGFYVGLLKDGSQIENYIHTLETQSELKKSKQSRTKALLETELRKRYEAFIIRL